MTREDFSIEHKEPWRFSYDPMKMFFDLDNISYSHSNCNSSHRTQSVLECGTRGNYRKGCRCAECKKANKDYHKQFLDNSKKLRREKKKRSSQFCKTVLVAR